MRCETSNTPATFTAGCWIKNDGAALAADSSPNIVAPLPSRIVRPSAAMFSASHMQSANAALIGAQLAAFSIGGTSAVIRFWWYDDVEATWSPLNTTLTVTSAGANAQTLVVRAMPGARYFCQVVSNTGVTSIAFMIR